MKTNLQLKSLTTKKQILLGTTATTVIHSTVLPNVNPMLKLALGIGAGTFLITRKNQIYKNLGKSLIAGSIIGCGINSLKKHVCEYSYKKHEPQNNSLLINTNTGEIIQKIGVPYWIYVTKEYSANKGWENSSKLTHCIKLLEGKGGGLPSKQGDAVIWYNLQNHTEKFNTLMSDWIEHFSNLKPFYENSYFDKLSYWRSMVDDKKPLDIKRTSFNPSVVSEWSIYENTLVRYDDYGNILYGAAGAAFELSENTLLLGANVNQILKDGLDESKDTFSIKRGIKIYETQFKQLGNLSKMLKYA